MNQYEDVPLGEFSSLRLWEWGRSGVFLWGMSPLSGVLLDEEAQRALYLFLTNKFAGVQP